MTMKQARKWYRGVHAQDTVGSASFRVWARNTLECRVAPKGKLKELVG